MLYIQFNDNSINLIYGICVSIQLTSHSSCIGFPSDVKLAEATASHGFPSFQAASMYPECICTPASCKATPTARSTSRLLKQVT